MSAPVVSWVRPARKQPEQQPQPQRLSRWPFPPSDPAERDRMAREHREQQRAAIVNGEESPL